MTDEDRWKLIEIKLRLNPHWTKGDPWYLETLRKRARVATLGVWENWVKSKEQYDVIKQQSHPR